MSGNLGIGDDQCFGQKDVNENHKQHHYLRNIFAVCARYLHDVFFSKQDIYSRHQTIHQSIIGRFFVIDDQYHCGSVYFMNHKFFYSPEA